jgi:hypothetical protein
MRMLGLLIRARNQSSTRYVRKADNDLPPLIAYTVLQPLIPVARYIPFTAAIEKAINIECLQIRHFR